MNIRVNWTVRELIGERLREIMGDAEADEFLGQEYTKPKMILRIRYGRIQPNSDVIDARYRVITKPKMIA